MWQHGMTVEMKFFYLLIGGLAAYRMSLMISKEDGPAYIFRKIRGLPPAKSSAKEGLSCSWCVSIWTGAVVALYLWLLGVFPGNEWPLHWLAISALAIICNQQWTKSS
jgi:hypothetical protein